MHDMQAEAGTPLTPRRRRTLVVLAIAAGAVEDPADDEPAAAPEAAPADVPEAGDAGPVT